MYFVSETRGNLRFTGVSDD